MIISIHFSFQKQFQEVKIEDLYQRFWLRLQQTLLMKLLVVMATCILIFLILNNVIVEHAVRQINHTFSFIYSPIACTSFTLVKIQNIQLCSKVCIPLAKTVFFLVFKENKLKMGQSVTRTNALGVTKYI